jgi:hypothetical protein
MTSLRRIAALALPTLLLVAACAPVGPSPRFGGTGSLSTEQMSFPTRDVIAKIAAAPAPAKLFDDRFKDVPTWELTGPLPDAVERTPPADDSPWGKLFAEVTAARGDAVAATEAMHCLARENAAFYLTNDALPAEPLERFIAARCGVPTGLGGTSFSKITADVRTSDEQLFAEFQGRTRPMIEKMLQPGRVEAGLAYVRRGGSAVLALAVVPQTVRVERTPLVPGPDGKVEIRGEVLSSAVGLRALINQGRYGYAECAVSRAVPLPRFAITCPTARDDEVAWLSVSALPPGRILGLPALEMLVWPSGAPGKVYAKLARTEASPAGASPADLVQEINRVRAEAKLSPLRLAEQQSATAARLAPHYVTELGGDKGTADQVALGLLAGWEVDGMVRDGHFVSMFLSEATSWSEVVRAAIARPVGRETLLDPAAERVAIGPVEGAKAHGALFTTYALFDSYRHDQDATLIATRIGNARLDGGVSRPRLASDLSAEAQRAASSVQAGQRTPQEAMNDLLQRIADHLGRGARALVLETTSLERMPLPTELVTRPLLTLGVGVAHHRNEGQPWGRFIVFIVLLDEGGFGPSTAEREGPKRG